MMSDRQLMCPQCDKAFRSADGLRQHKSRSHPVVPRPMFGCFYCKYKSNYKFALRKHIDRMHRNKDGTLNEYKVPNQPNQVCCICNTFECAGRNRMIDHYVDSHDVQINEAALNFIDFDEFTAWKRGIESQEYCRFVLSSSVRKRLTKHVWIFRCFRDGCYMPRGKGRRSLKVGGSIKIGSVCPCSIKVTKTLATGAVSVLYVTPHVGHKPEISKLTLSREERDRIKDRISAGVPDTEILAALHDSMSYAEINRMHLTTRKDIWNIRSRARLQTKGKAEAHIDVSAGAECNPARLQTQAKAEAHIDVSAGAECNPARLQTQAKAEAQIDDSAGAERTKFEDMKRALIRNISSLIESAKNCDQLEVIREALLPVPKAIRELP